MDAQIDLPKFSAHFEIKSGKEIILYKLNDPPGEIMDAFESLISKQNPNGHNDPTYGAARVSVSANLDDKEFGAGVGGMVVVSLACDQNTNSIHSAITLAQQAALHYAKQNIPEVRDEFVKLKEMRKSQGIHFSER